MVILKCASCWFPQKPIWLQETGAAAASAARGFHCIKVTRSLAAKATLPSNAPWPGIRATLLLFSAASGRRNDCTPGPGRSNIIFAFNPEKTVPRAFIDWLFAEPARCGVKLTSVEITAEEVVIESRIATKQRQQFRKLTYVTLY